MSDRMTPEEERKFIGNAFNLIQSAFDSVMCGDPRPYAPHFDNEYEAVMTMGVHMALLVVLIREAASRNGVTFDEYLAQLKARLFAKRGGS